MPLFLPVPLAIRFSFSSSSFSFLPATSFWFPFFFQVAVVSSTWPQKEEFKKLLVHYATTLEKTPCYYPNVGKTYADMREHYSARGGLILDGGDAKASAVTIVDCGTYKTKNFDGYSCVNEAFCLVLGWVEVEGSLSEMAAFVNSDEVCGSLSCTVLSPKSADAERVEAALREFKYGTVAHNNYNLLGYTAMGVGGMWGAYPTDKRSGVGTLGNVFRVEGAVNQILRGGSLEKMTLDVSQKVPVVVADVLHTAINGGGGAASKIGQISWLLLRRLGFFAWSGFGLRSGKGKQLPGSAVTMVE